MTDKEAYEAAGKFWNLPRCATCEHYRRRTDPAQCEKHGPIPADYLYTPNECPDYQFKIPF